MKSPRETHQKQSSSASAEGGGGGTDNLSWQQLTHTSIRYTESQLTGSHALAVAEKDSLINSLLDTVV